MSEAAVKMTKAGGAIRARIDSWVNLLTGLGDPTRDKLRAAHFQRMGHIDDETLEGIYHEDPFAARIVEKLPNDAFRQGFSIRAPASIDSEERKALEIELTDQLNKLGVVNKATEAAIWGRLFGGGVILIGADDGNSDLGVPLNLDAVKGVRFLKVLDKRDLYASAFYADPQAEKFGEVEVYELRPLTVRPRSGPSGNVTARSFSFGSRIHESRLVIFPGVLTTERERQRLNYWDHSVLTRVYDTLLASSSDWGAVSSMLHDASQGILKIKDFWEILAGGAKEQFEERLNAIDLARFVGRVMPIDTEEDFTYQERSFAGIPDLLDRLMMRTSTTADMPVSIYMGRSPAGMDATGELDIRSWYDTITAARRNRYQSRITRIVSIVAASMSMPEPEHWSIGWPSLWQMNPSEEAAHKKVVADSDVLWIQNDVLDPDEVRVERFGGDDFSASSPTVDINEPLEKQEPEPEPAPQQQLFAPVPEEAEGGKTDARRDGPFDFMRPRTSELDADMIALTRLARVTAPQGMMRRLTSRVIDGLGIGSQELHEAIEGHTFKWAQESIDVDITMTATARHDALVAGVPPVALDDLEALEKLTRAQAPQLVLRRLATRVAANLNILEGDLEGEIEKHDFVWAGSGGMSGTFT